MVDKGGMSVVGYMPVVELNIGGMLVVKLVIFREVPVAELNRGGMPVVEVAELVLFWKGRNGEVEEMVLVQGKGSCNSGAGLPDWRAGECRAGGWGLPEAM